MSELKLRRLTEHNQRLREDLARPRVRVSEASASLIRYCKTTKDHLIPSVWGPVTKSEDPYAPPAQGCNCIVIDITTHTMSTRTGGRQSMSELKLRRLIEHNQRLREDLARPRVRVSEASARCVPPCPHDHAPETDADFLSPCLVSSGTARQRKITSCVPSVWGPVGRAEDPYGQQATGKCCSIQ
ncbi:hypothetical protein CVT26_009279 [Gymnopilus dilepis]|uniref:Guanine nucleotide-binding protein subunit gamma n=1 Tax=Gymnopilus dilepis TaxID=231916 RepID=A0A409YAG1_9AGAR|nr:hypothetical protein CVT26_009279 [Gymnopilus dilepis]